MTRTGIVTKALLIGALAAITGQVALAEELECRFSKECEVGKRCQSSDYQVRFMREKSGTGYTVASDGALEANGLTSDTDGKMGTLVSIGPWATTPYAPVYVLSFSEAGAILTISELYGDDTPYVRAYLGKCKRTD